MPENGLLSSCMKKCEQRTALPVDSARIPVNIRTIAQAAGVNISTVSRALRNTGGVSAAACKRIQAIARHMGYRPNPFVAALTAQVRTYRNSPHPATIALLDCWPAERPLWASFDDSLDYIHGIRSRADALGYQVDLIRMRDMEYSVARLQRLLATRRLYGMLILPVPRDADLSGLDFTNLACATIDYSLQTPERIRRASPHYYHNTGLALAKLMERGYRRIGYVVTNKTARNQDDLCLAAFLAFSARHPRHCVAPCFMDEPQLQRELTAWLKRELPDAVLSADIRIPDDIIAAGFRVPKEIAAVSLCRPPATPPRRIAHINENYGEVGAQAVDMIVDAIHRNEFGIPKTRVVHFVDGFWCDGSTVRSASQ